MWIIQQYVHVHLDAEEKINFRNLCDDRMQLKLNNKLGKLRGLIEAKSKAMSSATSQFRKILLRTLQRRIRFRFRRRATIKVVVPNAVFANFVLPQLGDDVEDYNWTLQSDEAAKKKRQKGRQNHNAKASYPQAV